MTGKERVKLYLRAIRTFGATMQITVAIEEMSELTKELCKAKRGIGNTDHVAEEIADTIIMLEQLQIIFDCNERVAEIKQRKLERLQGRMEES